MVPGLSTGAGSQKSPVKHTLINLGALVQLLVKGFEISVGLSGTDMDHLVRLNLRFYFVG